MSTSKIDCLQKILKDSQAQKVVNDAKCLEEYTAVCLQIARLENSLEESRSSVTSLESKMATMQAEKVTSDLNMDEYRQTAIENLKALKSQLSSQADTSIADIKKLKMEMKAQADLSELEKTQLIDEYKKALKKMEEEEEARMDNMADEVSESFLIEIKALNEELSSANETLSKTQEDLEKMHTAYAALEDHAKEVETFGTLERQRHENQVIQLLKIVGIYDENSKDPLDGYWVDLFRIQMDEERMKIMTLKNCLMRFSKSLTTVDNGLLRGAGIILASNVSEL